MGNKNFTSKFLCCDTEFVSKALDDAAESILKKLGKDIPEPGQVIEIPLLIPTVENSFFTTKIVVEGIEEKESIMESYNGLLKLVKVNTDSDEMRKDEFIGSLYEYACIKANEAISEIARNLDIESLKKKIRIINIESSTSSSHITPRIDNSDTWYYRDNIYLKIWYTIE